MQNETIRFIFHNTSSFFLNVTITIADFISRVHDSNNKANRISLWLLSVITYCYPIWFIQKPLAPLKHTITVLRYDTDHSTSLHLNPEQAHEVAMIQTIIVHASTRMREREERKRFSNVDIFIWLNLLQSRFISQNCFSIWILKKHCFPFRGPAFFLRNSIHIF